jgi:transposase
VHRMVTLGRLQAKQVCRGAPWVLKAADVAEFAIMDNLGSHKGKFIRKLIRSARAKLFFRPKYSPDLNPIEQVFAKLKHLLRKAAA